MKLFKQKQGGFIGAFLFAFIGFFIGGFTGLFLGIFTDVGTGVLEIAGLSLVGGLIGAVIGFFIGFLIPTVSIFLWGLTILYVVAPDVFPGFIDDFFVVVIRLAVRFFFKT